MCPMCAYLAFEYSQYVFEHHVAEVDALGLAGAGIRLLFERGVDAEGEPSSGAAAALRPEFDAVLDAQLAPRSPIGDGALATDAGATAMLDVSDGLVLDARRIARASGVRIDFRAADLDTDVVALERVLHGGEDHALLATFPAGVRLPGGFRAIGSVVDGDGVTLDGEVLDKRGGWDPYADWDGASG